MNNRRKLVIAFGAGVLTRQTQDSRGLLPIHRVLASPASEIFQTAKVTRISHP